MDVAAFRPDQPAAMRAYVVQYVSLIIIILSFVIGSFSQQKLAAGRAVSQPSAEPVRSTLPQARVDTRDFLKSQLRLEESDLPREQREVPARIEALAALLINHDVNLEISAGAGGDALQTLESLAMLTRELQKSGVPSRALSAVVHNRPQPQDHGVELNFWWDRASPPTGVSYESVP